MHSIGMEEQQIIAAYLRQRAAHYANSYRKPPTRFTLIATSTSSMHSMPKRMPLSTIREEGER
jgi:hypothetical protein